MPAGPVCLLLDQTLREGAQQPGVGFGLDERLRLLPLLEDFGHRLIEVGHPGISAEHEAVCRRTAQAARTAQVLMHARAHLPEVHAVHRAGADWIGIWASVNDLSLAVKFGGRDVEQVWARVEAAVAAAVRLGLQVRFTVEDASRTPWEAVHAVASVALAAGAHRISLADTTGCWQPRTCAETVSRAVQDLGSNIEVHLHNDLGLAHANALAAVEAGAAVVDVSALGLGERAGIVNSAEVATSLHLLYGDSSFDLAMIPLLARTVEEATGYRADALRPITGANVFSHTSAYHVKAVCSDPRAYEFIPPDLVGRVRGTVLQPATPQPGAAGPPAFGTCDAGEPATRADRQQLSLVGRPFPKGASELRYHRDGPGARWVMLDSRVDHRASLYVIQRHFDTDESTPPADKHVDTHAHHCDSAFLFWGHRPDGTGLTCSVTLDGSVVTVYSPASVFIPAGVRHSYHHLGGNGTYTNIVLAPEYNTSLVPDPEDTAGG